MVRISVVLSLVMALGLYCLPSVEAKDGGSISQSQILRETLSADDVALLDRVNGEERVVTKSHQEYIAVYYKMRDLQSSYAQTTSESDALGYVAEFEKIKPSLDSLSQEMSQRWDDIYDNKTYLYYLLMESLDHDDIAEQADTLLRNALIRSAELGGGVIVDYECQKRALVDYERAIAKALDLRPALDSLNGVAKQLSASGDVASLPELEIVERNFITYDNLKFSSTQIYTTKNPIPMAKEYKNGRIYRIQLGAYNNKQLATIFRGVQPLSYDKTFGFWTYYCGGFPTLLEARAAQALCKTKGFKRPEIVQWKDGVRRNLSREPIPATKGCRVSIKGVEELPDRIDEIAKRMCKGATFSKLGADHYLLGVVSELLLAEEFIEAVEAEFPDLTLSMVKIE